MFFFWVAFGIEGKESEMNISIEESASWWTGGVLSLKLSRLGCVFCCVFLRIARIYHHVNQDIWENVSFSRHLVKANPSHTVVTFQKMKDLISCHGMILWECHFLHPKRLKKNPSWESFRSTPHPGCQSPAGLWTIFRIGNPELNLHLPRLHPGWGGRSKESLWSNQYLRWENRLAGASGLLLAVKGGKTEVISCFNSLGGLGWSKKAEPLK